MLRRQLCEVTFDWQLTCEGPLLIADGRYEQEIERKYKGKDKPKGLTDKLFVCRDPIRTVVPKVEARIHEPPTLSWYVPGTSLRGPLRSQAERIVRSLLPGDAAPPATACDPFQEETGQAGALQSCSKRLGEAAPDAPYQAACPACKLFGCTATASRLDLPDAAFTDRGTSVYRDMIGIDRFHGGVHSGANMRFHALEGTAFSTTVTVRNFELWQLGLLAFAFRDVQEGRVPIGFGKTKGFGRVQGEVTGARVRVPADAEPGKLHHLGSLAGPSERERYALRNDPAPELPLTREGSTGPLELYATYRVDDLDALWREAARAFTGFIEAQAPANGDKGSGGGADRGEGDGGAAEGAGEKPKGAGAEPEEAGG